MLCCSRMTWSVLAHMHPISFTLWLLMLPPVLGRGMVAKENNGSIVWRLEESFTVVARVVRLIY